MNCVIIDDHKAYRVVLRKMIAMHPSLNLLGEYANGIAAYNDLENKQIDLLFLDINMPEMNGIALARLLQHKHFLIIFITSQAEHAVEAFELNVVDFLIKPFEPARFIQAVEKANKIFLERANKKQEPLDSFVFIRDSNIVRNLKLADILFFEAKDNYVKVYLTNNNYSIHSQLKSIAQKLPPQFVRVHRSFIVNLAKIDTMEGSTLFINKMIVPVSDSYRAALNKQMQML